MEHLRSVQRDVRRQLYEDSPPVPFPFLERPSMQEMNDILKVVTIGKALTCDLVSDSVLTKEHFARACEVLQDLWCSLDINEMHFRSRLIPLNKKHP